MIYIEMDDKSRIPYGKVMAQNGTKLLIEDNGTILCGVRILDHDFPVGPKHGYVCSVYRAYKILKKGHIDDHKRVSWEGPTFVVLRSGYHCIQTAYNHGDDLKRFIEDPDFQEWMQIDGDVKPILCIGGDNGPDESISSEKVQRMCLMLMKLRHLN